MGMIAITEGGPELEVPLTEKTPPTGNSVASIKLGGRAYPNVSVPQCRVCRSPMGLAIERAIVIGAGYAATARTFPEAHLTGRNIEDHFANSHLPLRDEAVRRLQEEDGEQRAHLVEIGAEAVADQLELARLVVGRVRQRVARGEVEPTIRDGLKATEILTRALAEDSSTSNQASAALTLYSLSQIAREVLNKEQYRLLSAGVASDPVLTAILAKPDRPLP